MELKDFYMENVKDVITDHTIVIGTHNTFVKTFTIPATRLSPKTVELFKKTMLLKEGQCHIWPDLLLGFILKKSNKDCLVFHAVDPHKHIGYIIKVVKP